MRNRARVIAAAAVAAAVAAGTTGAAMASSGTKPGSPAKSVSASEEPGGSKAVGSKSGAQRQGTDAFVAAVAAELHVSASRVSAALRPLFAAGSVNSSSPVLAAAARSLGVSTQRLSAALIHAKMSLGTATHARQKPRGSRAVGSKSGAQRPGHKAFVAAVARELHVSAARVNAALRPLFAAGSVNSSSPVLAAAARSLGVSAQRLSAALVHAKMSLAGGG